MPRLSHSTFQIRPLKADPKTATPILLDLLAEHDGSANPRYLSGQAEAVSVIGALGVDVPPEMVLQLYHRETGSRWVAAIAIAGFGKRAAPVVPDLVTALRDPDGRVVSAAYYALAQVGPDAKDALDPMTAIIRESPSRENGHHYAIYPGGSAHFLELFGRLGPETMPILREFLDHENPDVRKAVVKGLGAFGKEAIPDLIAALNDPAPNFWCAAVVALGNFRSDAKQCLPALVEQLAKAETTIRPGISSSYYRRAILHSIHQIAPHDELTRAARIAPQLTKYSGFRRDAIVAAIRSGVADDDDLWEILANCTDSTEVDSILATIWPENVPLLLRALADKASKCRRWQAARAFAYVDFSQNAAVVTALLGELDDPEFLGKQAAFATLRAGALEVLPHLIIQLRNPSAEVREQCRAAIRGIVRHFSFFTPTMVLNVVSELRRVERDLNVPDRKQLEELIYELGSHSQMEKPLPDLVAELRARIERGDSTSTVVQNLLRHRAAAVPFCVAALEDDRLPNKIRYWLVRSLE